MTIRLLQLNYKIDQLINELALFIKVNYNKKLD